MQLKDMVSPYTKPKCTQVSDEVFKWQCTNVCGRRWYFFRRNRHFVSHDRAGSDSRSNL
jgi:hypothetical protein